MQADRFPGLLISSAQALRSGFSDRAIVGEDVQLLELEERKGLIAPAHVAVQIVGARPDSRSAKPSSTPSAIAKDFFTAPGDSRITPRRPSMRRSSFTAPRPMNER